MDVQALKVIFCAALALLPAALFAQAAPGPRLSDADLFAALDLSTPGLEATRQAGDMTAARHALATYLRARTSVSWSFDPRKIDRAAKYNKQAAEDAAAGKVVVVTIPYTFPEGKIDWFANPTLTDKRLAPNYEWQWQLGRMAFWGDLGRAYWATGDEPYAQAFVSQLRSWVAQAPRPDNLNNGNGSAWRTIECGIRMSGSWPEAYHRFLLSPSFSDDDVILFLKSCVEQARYLRRYPTQGNWLTMEMAGLYTVGAQFPELKEAKEWRDYSAGRLYAELNIQFLPDGAQRELTPGYHQVAVDNILRIAQMAKLVGRQNELPAGYIDRLEKAYDYTLYLMTPNRSLPRFNDSWDVNVPNVLKVAADLYPDRTDFAWVASEGKLGAAPARTSHPFPWAGYFAMRSGWDRSANFFCLDAGPLGAAHVHQDKLNVVLWAYGREILFDGGGGSYEHSRWRDYGVDTFSHNTVLVDGKPQRRVQAGEDAVVSRPIDAHWESDVSHDYAQGIYEEGYGAPSAHLATHTRRVLFVKPDLFVVADTLTPSDKASHTYQARWQLLTTRTDLDPATQTVTTTDGGKANLAVVPLQTNGLQTRAVSAQTEPELLGWLVGKDLDSPHVPATTVLHTRQGTGPQTFLTLLLPLRPNAPMPIKSVHAVNATTTDVLLVDGRRLLISASADSDGTLRVTETRAGGQPGRQASGGGGNVDR